MISVVELDNIARARIEDAKALLTAGRFDGATYLCGYAVEIALKARICRTLNWTEFPSTGSEFQAYRSFQTPNSTSCCAFQGRRRGSSRTTFRSGTPWPSGRLSRDTMLSARCSNLTQRR